MTDVVVIGGGIIGLAVARELTLRRGYSVTVLEKEAEWAAQQAAAVLSAAGIEVVKIPPRSSAGLPRLAGTG